MQGVELSVTESGQLLRLPGVTSQQRLLTALPAKADKAQLLHHHDCLLLLLLSLQDEVFGRVYNPPGLPCCAAQV